MNIDMKDNFFELIKNYFAVYLPTQRQYSEHTIKSYRYTMESFIDFIIKDQNIDILDICFEKIDSQILRRYLTHLEENNSSSTINQRISAIRSFYKYVSIMDISKVVYRQEILKIPISKSNIHNNKLKYLEENQITSLLNEPNKELIKELRDAFLMLLLYDSGVRVNELLNLKLKDIKIGNQPYITVFGKGKKYRNIPICKETVTMYSRYMKIYHPESNNEKYIFFVTTHKITHKMSDDNVNLILKKYAKKVAEEDDNMPLSIHAHMIRHSRAMHLYKGGMPLPLVAEWLGHKNLETTSIYAYADTEMKRKAIEKATKGKEIMQEKESSLFLESENREEIIKKLYGLK